MDSTMAKENMMKNVKTAQEELTLAKENALREIKSGLANAEELLKETSSSAGEARVNELTDKIKEHLREHLGQCKERFHAFDAAAREKTRMAADATDDFVRDNPWQAVGIAAGVGLILGLLIGRR